MCLVEEGKKPSGGEAEKGVCRSRNTGEQMLA